MRDGDDITTLRARVEELEREQHKLHTAMRTLERLTPGGSEYVNDPKQCESFIRRTRTMQHEAILRFKRERDEARRDLAALRAKYADTPKEGGDDADSM